MAESYLPFKLPDARQGFQSLVIICKIIVSTNMVESDGEKWEEEDSGERLGVGISS